ncbi:hypothetical protein SEA_VORVOLAKOS_45 [Streptomyces phage Vorvolakos]|uniref:Uncharacterized protein n=3 Tax=Flowerpowervirus flowerpower TaxID=2846396 RepID=A0A2U8UNY0_9CAUD|nr:hypothetical protein HWB61_gp56 [Streptomyces phage FlowerPower]QEA11247.1 hypothetical protein SEA_GEOSTIN_40 [Streptomyces phage Geostin]QFP94743.1 hypothetical protein SEA_FABIAN_42 [Streptomyces phage Fabian]QZD97091.1 hypothetical protein SEA_RETRIEVERFEVER_45 [Streptomyces phage RetrieverFever]UOW93258.1 hypothetical protein SEA_VORVOLAKOS_45 [Streptomyces phage Vorvolakos]AWN05126.1 hypothetical protein SEA_FLOWERPOWER_45 [Streptomyces phage FlowerPower]
MATLVRKIPDQLSGLGSAVQGQYNLQDNAYDYALAGIPFLSATQDNRPYTERMAEIRKQQFDAFAEPGEQSISGNFWWLRSQSTFNGGAGLLYQDPDNDNQFNFKFADSLGVDPWTSGQLKLLRDVGLVAATAATPLKVKGFVDGSGVDAYWVTYNDHMDKVTDSGTTAIIGATLDTIRDITSSGKRYFIAVSNGIKTGVDAGATSVMYTGTYNSSAELEFLKGRLILGHDNKVYQLVTTASSAALPTAVYTHQDDAWNWQSFTDGPTAIYGAGDSGTTSEIHKFTPTLDSSGIPVLTWGGVTATMPAGETIRTIYQYVGSFVGIATNKGFRVGDIDQNGDISYGPLLFEPEGGCEGIVGHDRFFYVGSTNAHDGNSGLFRVDLGNAVQEQTTRAIRYAYARDIYYGGDESPITSVTMFGKSDRKVFSLSGFGHAKEFATTLVPNGYLTTGRIRFNTEEPKLYKFFSVRTPSPLQGNVAATILTEGGGEIDYITYSPSIASGIKDVAISNPAGPQNWIRLKFTLFQGSNPAFGGVLNGWQMKALPGSIRQRVITQIFELFDEETDRTGQRIGYDGYSRQRFEDFKAVARAGDVVLFQELQEDLSTLVLIEDWEFRQTAPPGPNRGALGGYLTVQMRTVAEST